MGSRKQKSTPTLGTVISEYKSLSVHEKINYKWLMWQHGRSHIRIADALKTIAKDKEKFQCVSIKQRLLSGAYFGQAWLTTHDFYPRLKAA
jgi:hypothetical protein